MPLEPRRALMTMQENQLWERFAQGDPDAYEAVFREFQDEVHGWILRLVRDRAAAEDLTIETFWRIYRSRRRFDPERSFGAWARRIATNVAIDHLKRRRRDVELPQSLASDSEPDGMAQDEIKQRIEAAFRRLSPRLQVAARLALIEERPYDEIAEALGLGTGAVKSRVFRAVRLLQEELKDLGERL
jgi:RNA polymerase sigma-70 factor (ECF subfamily)